MAFRVGELPELELLGHWDARAAYRWTVEQVPDPNQLVVAGDSFAVAGRFLAEPRATPGETEHTG